MQYVGIITPVVIALVGSIESFLGEKTPPWKKRLIPFVALLTLTAGGYSLYKTYTNQKIMEPWEATQVVYSDTVDAWKVFTEARAAKESEALQAVIDKFTHVVVRAETTRAPSYIKGRVQLLAISAQLWAMAEKYPDFKPVELIEELIQFRYKGTIYEDTPVRFLSRLGFFRAEDFGPPHRLLRGYSSLGKLVMDPKRFTKAFLTERAFDLFTDLKGMAQ